MLDELCWLSDLHGSFILVFNKSLMHHLTSEEGRSLLLGLILLKLLHFIHKINSLGQHVSSFRSLDNLGKVLIELLEVLVKIRVLLLLWEIHE